MWGAVLEVHLVRQAGVKWISHLKSQVSSLALVSNALKLTLNFKHMVKSR